MKNLTKHEIIKIHEIIQKYSKTTPGIKNEGLLEAVVERPDQILYGTEVFPDIYSKAASLFEGIARWHMFIDGNKRTALMATQIYLQKNDYFQYFPFSAVRFSVEVAKTHAENEGEEQEVTKKLIDTITQWLTRFSCHIHDHQKIIKIYDENIKILDVYLDLEKSDPKNAKRLFEEWMAVDIYPEYKKDMVEITNFIKSLQDQSIAFKNIKTQQHNF